MLFSLGWMWRWRHRGRAPYLFRFLSKRVVVDAGGGKACMACIVFALAWYGMMMASRRGFEIVNTHPFFLFRGIIYRNLSHQFVFVHRSNPVVR